MRPTAVALALGDGEHVLCVVDSDDAVAGLRERDGGAGGADGDLEDRLAAAARHLAEEERDVLLEKLVVRVLEVVILGDGAVAFHVGEYHARSERNEQPCCESSQSC